MMRQYWNRFLQWKKKNRKLILLVIFVFLLCLVSFGLGYISARDLPRPAIVIEPYR